MGRVPCAVMTMIGVSAASSRHFGDRVETVHVGQRTSSRIRSYAPLREPVEQVPRGGSDLHLVLLADQGLPEDEGQVLVVLGRSRCVQPRCPTERLLSGWPRRDRRPRRRADRPRRWSRTRRRSTTSRLPRCASTIWRAMASPSPVPRDFVVKNGWKMRSRSSAGMPAPVLRTDTRTAPGRARLHPDVDHPVGRRGLERVLDQVREDLAEPERVTPHRRHRAVAAHAHARIGREHIEHVLDERRDRHGLAGLRLGVGSASGGSRRAGPGGRPPG